MENNDTLMVLKRGNFRNFYIFLVTFKTLQ